MAKSKNAVVNVHNVRKTFHIPLESSSGIKQKLINHLKGRKGYREFSPLNGISFEIEEGDFFGIVGRNGSGKSTLLKTIAGIYSPTNGSVEVKGKLIPFIELGVGFNPELTGRENVFLNGALLGFSHKEMEAMYDEIVDFAELHDFMEERLKNYSSGMQVRLAFSIAIRAEGDILLLDEVLAVGDEAFQRKCFSYFDKLKFEKKTVILVTHDMSSVEKYCNRALYLQDGEVALIGSPHEVANFYSEKNDEAVRLESKKYNHEPSMVRVTMSGSDGIEKEKFTSSEVMTVDLEWKYTEVQNIGVAVFKKSGEYIYGTNTYVEKVPLPRPQSIRYNVKLNLVEGEYFLKVGFFGKTDSEHVDFIEEGLEFIVNRSKQDARWQGIVKLESKWS